jgi:predicted small lipoprotein YifL
MPSTRAQRLPTPAILLTLTLAGALAACGRSAPDAPPDAAPAHTHDHDHDHHHHHHHHHEAPRGGTLVELGDHVAHIEFLLDDDIGLLRAYFLDGHAENPVQMAEAAYHLEITPEDAEESFPVTLEAQLNPLTGERPGATSEYAGRSDHLIGLERFEVQLPAITVRGVDIPAMVFPFPEGNE